MSENLLPEERNVEYLNEFNAALARAVVAYANTDGGRIYIGFDELGRGNGVANPKDTIERVLELARGSVCPNAEDLVDCSVRQYDGKTIVVVAVSRGYARPYCLASKGFTAQGVLVRESNATVPSSERVIRRLVDETSDGSYERARARRQDLTFTYATQVFERAKVPFGREQFFELGLYDAEGLYTNLALLFSDQCPSTLKLAFFEGTRENQLHDRLNISGSIFQQFDDVYAYLDQYNRAYSKLHGANRGDFRDYPPEILREILLNAIVHRDYSKDFKTIVRCYYDHLEIASVGGAPQALSFDELLLGVSAPRNPKLADAFYQLQLVENCGVGVRKVRQAYANYTLKPRFEVSPNYFKVTLYHAYAQQLEKRVLKENVRVARYADPVKISVAPNRAVEKRVEEPENVVERPRATISGKDSLSVAARDLNLGPTATAARGYALSDRERLVLQMFNHRDTITRRDVETSLNLTQASAAAILRRLVNSGRIVLCGAGDNIWYRRP